MKRSICHLLLALSGGVVLVVVLIIAVLLQLASIQIESRELPTAADWRSPDVPASHRHSPLPPPDYYSVCTQDYYTLCLRIYTGTVRSTFTISNPSGVSGFNSYYLANFNQRVLNQSPTALMIEVTTHRYLDTRAPYPVDAGALPSNVRPYLLPEPGWIQSDNPLIVTKAQELVSGTTRQAEAVDAIVAWVRGNIRYEGDHPSDALSVFNNRAGVCAGFSTLTAALLRAAGIPAKYHVGCVSKWGDGGWGWVVGEGGGWHAWNELYYPDVGWVALDPQVSTNYLDTGHILAGFDQCGEAGTVITRTNHQADDGFLYDLRTPYTSSTWPSLWVANVPTWDRHSLRVIPSSLSTMLAITNPVGSLALQVENRSCWGQDWQIRTGTSWLTPTIITATSTGTAWFTVNASGMYTGFYTGSMTVYATSSPWLWPWAISRTVTVDLWLVDEVYRVYLPLAAKGN